MASLTACYTPEWVAGFGATWVHNLRMLSAPQAPSGRVAFDLRLREPFEIRVPSNPPAGACRACARPSAAALGPSKEDVAEGRALEEEQIRLRESFAAELRDLRDVPGSKPFTIHCPLRASLIEASGRTRSSCWNSLG